MAEIIFMRVLLFLCFCPIKRIFIVIQMICTELSLLNSNNVYIKRALCVEVNDSDLYSVFAFSIKFNNCLSGVKYRFSAILFLSLYLLFLELMLDLPHIYFLVLTGLMLDGKA